MNKMRTFQVGVLIAFTLISIYVGNKVYHLDDKEALDYLVPFALFVFCYLIFGFIYILFRAYKALPVKVLIIQFAISLTPLLLIPYGFLWKESSENEIAVGEMNQKAHAKYLVELEKLNSEILQEPDSPILYVKRGQLKRSQGLWEESIADCRISLDKKETTEAYWELGWCQWKCIFRLCKTGWFWCGGYLCKQICKWQICEP